MFKIQTRDIAIKTPTLGIKSSTPSLDEKGRVQKDIYSLIKLVASSQGIKIDSKDLPGIDFLPQGSFSAYDKRKNKIYIALDKIGNGASYSAEAGHFLRDYATGKIYSSGDLTSEEARVHEFFDRATYQIAKDISKGTPISHLFRKEEIDYSSKEGRQKLASLGKEARSDLREAKYAKNDPAWMREAKMRESKSDLFQFKSHVAYSFADKYSGKKLANVPNFYYLPNEEVQRKFLRKGSLETKVGAVAVSALVPGVFFFSTKITGNVIGLSNITSSLMGGVLILIGLVAGFFWVRSKKR